MKRRDWTGMLIPILVGGLLLAAVDAHPFFAYGYGVVLGAIATLLSLEHAGWLR